MRPGDNSRFLSKTVATSRTVTTSDLEQFGHIVATAANLILTHPQPSSGLAGYEAVYTNASTGLTSIVCRNGFVDASGVIVLEPGESIHLYCQQIGVSSYAWLRQGKDSAPKPTALSASEYTATWGTANPATPTALILIYKYKGLCWIQGQLSGADGNDASSLTLALDTCIPQDIDLLVALSGEQIVDGARTADFVPYVDCKDNTAGNRGVMGFRNFAALTNAKAWSIRFSGCFPLYGATAYTSAPAWTAGPPTVASTTAYFTNVDGEVYWWLHNILTDGKDATGATFTPPLYPQSGMGLYCMGRGYVVLDTGGTPAYTDCKPFHDCAHATPGSRLFGFKGLPTLTNAKACEIVASGHYPLENHRSVSPTEVFTGTAPGSWTTNRKMRASKTGRVLNVHYYSTSTDGNGCTDIDLPLPAVPLEASMLALMTGFQLVNTAKSNPVPYVDLSLASGASRAKAQLAAMSTFTNAVTATMILSGELLLDT